MCLTLRSDQDSVTTLCISLPLTLPVPWAENVQRLQRCRRISGNKSPRVERRRRPAVHTPPRGARPPMECTSSGGLREAAASSEQRLRCTVRRSWIHWCNDGNRFGEDIQMICSSTTARPRTGLSLVGSGWLQWMLQWMAWVCSLADFHRNCRFIPCFVDVPSVSLWWVHVNPQSPKTYPR